MSKYLCVFCTIIGSATHQAPTEDRLNAATEMDTTLRNLHSSIRGFDSKRKLKRARTIDKSGPRLDQVLHQVSEYREDRGGVEVQVW